MLTYCPLSSTSDLSFWIEVISSRGAVFHTHLCCLVFKTHLNNWLTALVFLCSSSSLLSSFNIRTQESKRASLISTLTRSRCALSCWVANLQSWWVVNMWWSTGNKEPRVRHFAVTHPMHRKLCTCSLTCVCSCHCVLACALGMEIVHLFLNSQNRIVFTNTILWKLIEFTLVYMIVC